MTQLATEWLTTDEVLSLRSEMNWVSPIAPFEPGQLWCVWDHGRTLEWFTHPADASAYLEDGIVVDGERLDVHLIDRWPLLNAWQIRAYAVADR